MNQAHFASTTFARPLRTHICCFIVSPSSLLFAPYWIKTSNCAFRLLTTCIIRIDWRLGSVHTRDSLAGTRVGKSRVLMLVTKLGLCSCHFSKRSRRSTSFVIISSFYFDCFCVNRAYCSIESTHKCTRKGRENFKVNLPLIR